MGYKFESIQKTKNDLFVHFSHKGEDGTHKYLSVGAHKFLAGAFAEAATIKSVEQLKAAGHLVLHDYVIPERKLA